MINIAVNTSKTYNIIIGSGILNLIGSQISRLKNPCKIAIISDTNIWPLYGKTVTDSLTDEGFDVVYYTFPAGEASKNIETYNIIVNFLADAHLSRSDLLLALGGGVVGDITGFAAATYLRGISYIQVPTSLLAMVDSSVGGKTGVNLSSGKNLAGAFHQPKAVLTDVRFLETLSDREIRNGLGEIVKYGVGLSRELFELLENNIDKLNSLDLEFYQKIIYDCCAVKCRIVQEDEKEHGCRALLNLGHTFGHAIEAVSNFEITHGEAVAIGLICAGQLALKLDLWKQSDFDRMKNLASALQLPSKLKKEWKFDDMIKIMLHDKKTENGRLNIVLPDAIGSSLIQKNVSSELIIESMEACRE